MSSDATNGPRGEIPDHWKPVVSKYAEWIDAEDLQTAKRWCQRLGADDSATSEGALNEAIAWEWIRHRVDRVALGGTMWQRAPDFCCVIGQTTFHIEVTAISRAAMTTYTGMTDDGLHSGTYGFPYGRIRRKIDRKATQSMDLGSPCLAFICTLHWNGSTLLRDRKHLEWVLSSPEFLTAQFDPERGEVVGPTEQVTDFRIAAFTKPGTVSPWHDSVSGVLFGPFGLLPERVEVHGILNPTATHVFDPRLLHETPFAYMAKWPPDASGKFRISWTDQEPQSP